MVREKIITLLLRHPEYSIKTISDNYPFSISQLKKYKKILDWDWVSNNPSINWSPSLLNEFSDYINWKSLTSNPSAFLDLSILDIFEEKIDWKGDEGAWMDSITINSGLPWDLEFIKRVEGKIDFHKLSSSHCVKWSEQLIDKYIDRWDMAELACNISVPWNLKLFEKYLDVSYLEYEPVKWNNSLIRDSSFVEKYQLHLDWSHIFSKSNLPWAEMDLMNKWHDKIDWWGIALNEKLFTDDKQLFHKHIDKWYLKNPNGLTNFSALSLNKSLPWTKEFIKTYMVYWDWDFLSINKGLPWNKDLIDLFSEKWLWGGFFSVALLDEDGNVISPEGGVDFYDGLVTNKALPWSVDFINYYENQIDFKALFYNDSIWEKAFKPFVDDRMVDTVLRII